MQEVLLLSAGGAGGAMVRYGCSLLLLQVLKGRFKITPILLINLVGAFGLGVFSSYFYEGIVLGAYEDALYLFIGIGFFGAFTTFSTFSTEIVTLFQDRQWKKMSIYLLVTAFGSVALFFIGISVI